MGLRSVFGGVSANALALDIGADSIKVLALQRKGSKVRVVGAGVEKTPPHVVVDGQIMDQTSLLPCIKSAITKAGVANYRGLPTVVGLRGVCVVCARLLVPVLGDEEMAEQILVEAQQHIDSDLAEWRVDYDVVTKPDERGQVVVMLVGARNSMLDGFRDALKALHLSLDVVDLDVFAMANALESARGDDLRGNTLCLDLGRDATRIYLMSDRTPLVIRSVSLGGFHLTNALSEMIGVDVDAAEELKLTAHASPDTEMGPEIQRCLDSFVSELVAEVKSTLAFFSDNVADGASTQIDRVFLSGGSAGVRGLGQKIAETFESQVMLLNPFSRLEVVPECLDAIGADSHSYAVAAGLALRKKNDKDVVEGKQGAVSLAGLKNLAIPQSSKKIVGMVVGGALVFGLITLGTNMMLGDSKPSKAVNMPAPQMDDAGIPKNMPPEQYGKMLEHLEKAEGAAKAEGKPFGRKKQLDRLKEMKAQGKF
jgi:type IV pilus assembly protein PilM